MRTNILTLLLVAFTFVVNAKVSPISITSKDFNLTLDLETISKHGADISIRSNEGSIIFTNKVKSNEKRRVLNMTSLPIGKYLLTIENDSKIVDQSFIISNQGVLVDGEEVETFKPTFTMNNNSIYINSLTLGHSGYIRILTSANEEILIDTFNDVASINKAYSLVNLEKGNYTVNLMVNGKSFYYNIEK